MTATCDLMQHDCHLYFISVTAQCMAAIFIFVSVTAGQEGFEGVTALWDLIKEYTYISDRRDSTPLRLTNIWLSQPFPALSAVYCTTCPSDKCRRGEVGRVKCLEDEGGCCPFYHWYIFFGPDASWLPSIFYFCNYRSGGFWGCDRHVGSDAAWPQMLRLRQLHRVEENGPRGSWFMLQGRSFRLL